MPVLFVCSPVKFDRGTSVDGFRLKTEREFFFFYTFCMQRILSYLLGIMLKRRNSKRFVLADVDENLDSTSATQSQESQPSSSSSPPPSSSSPQNPPKTNMRLQN